VPPFGLTIDQWLEGTMSTVVDLVADVGEGFGDYRIADDAELLRIVSSANIACGFHAGDPRTMQEAVAACIAHGVGVGAHPGFHDLVGFGRRAIDQTPLQTTTDVLYQLGALQAFAQAAGTRLRHVAPHGRLGNLVVSDEAVARAVLDGIEAFDRSLIVVTSAGALQRAALDRGLTVGLLGFPDRAYSDDGTLVPRRERGAVIHDAEDIARRAVEMATTGGISSRNGTRIALDCHSLLLHGDNPVSVTAARLVRHELERVGVMIAPLADVLDRRAPTTT
jgi:5-oxoprolinase (ATP-hydrolysing) subunit A